MAKRNRGRSLQTATQSTPHVEREVYLCSDVDCKQFGIHTYRPGRCGRCGMEKLEKDEWEDWNNYLGTHPSTLRVEVDWEPSEDVALNVARQEALDALEEFQDGPTLGKALPAPLAQVANDTWEVPACLNSCPIAPKAHIYVPDAMFKQWIDLAREFKTEWIAYLQGYALPDKPFSYEVNGMTFPRQLATETHVKIEDGERAPAGTIAAVHSHVGMDVFFSGEDQKHFNWPVELVVNRRGEIKANGLVTLECGRQHRSDATVWITGRETFRSLATALGSVLTEQKWQTQVATQPVVQPIHINHVKN